MGPGPLERSEGPLWVLGTPEVPLVEGSVSPLPSRKGVPVRPFLVLGLGRQGARAGTKWTESLNPGRSLSPQGPCIPQFSVLHLARCHFFLWPLPRPPVRPLVVRAWLKFPVPPCVKTSTHLLVSPESRSFNGATQEPHPSPYSSVEPPPFLGWYRIANSVVRCAFP